LNSFLALFCVTIDPARWTSEGVTAAATVAIACFTIVLAGATIIQSKLTRQSINLARQEFISTHRPLLKIKLVTLTSDANERAAVNFTVINAGQSDAVILGSSVLADFLPATSWPHPMITIEMTSFHQEGDLYLAGPITIPSALANFAA
jgi:hypothetical protein